MNDSWENLTAECESCQACALSQTRTNCVFGAGNKRAKLMFVGEAPGDNEDKTGTPFIGRAGKLLDEFLHEAGLYREEVYIANILKCRPPQNRDPLPAEEAACMDFLRRQIALIRPEIIVCLGRISAMKLIKPDFKITKEHGVFFEKDGVIITAVYHPALLLRDPRKKPEMLEDMLSIKRKLDTLTDH